MGHCLEREMDLVKNPSKKWKSCSVSTSLSHANVFFCCVTFEEIT
jgi:hypothetical protein